MPDYLVVFTKSNAVVVKDPVEIEKYKKYPNSFLNPSLLGVKYLDTKYWRWNGKQIVPMGVKDSLKRTKKKSKLEDLKIKPIWLFRLYPKMYYLCLAIPVGLYVIRTHNLF